jgi:hypothetical protein
MHAAFLAYLLDAHFHMSASAKASSDRSMNYANCGLPASRGSRHQSNDIVDNTVKAKDHATYIAAVKAADFE